MTKLFHAGKPATSISFLAKLILLCAVQDPNDKAGFARVLLSGLIQMHYSLDPAALQLYE